MTNYFWDLLCELPKGTFLRVHIRLDSKFYEGTLKELTTDYIKLEIPKEKGVLVINLLVAEIEAIYYRLPKAKNCKRGEK